MIQTVLAELFERDLGALRAEIEAYRNEGDLWRVEGEIANSAGNLCLHLTGNLRHFFGAVLGGTEYVRDRDAEFASKFVPRATLLEEVDAALEEVRAVLEKLSEEDLDKNYPIEVFGKPMSKEFFLIHLATHLNYHLGQINYHRRLLGG
ncbi:MAG TPA: DinB family protein [Pyrinomonadaceae bacterium]|nr:DinB family protein [Pyrinomonadaceae bacterium]HMP66149.1 DinB family protein [Pyrinomonadaceae bacterium]